ncbi:hypothetical protein BKA70DRAFT_1089307 [Coprinopsis sp. MPI-PUGE-AT-0042]|nr:hypothetical protein BKA70DRAFT_1089307 [Coprinopsis sp. MPI-PUGE-AT-0042]
MQLSQVLSLRPKRGRLFWAMVAYTVIVFIMSTAAVGGRFRFAELMYVENKTFEGGFLGYLIAHMDRWENVLNHISLSLLAWFCDILMLYRLFVLWNYKWCVLPLPIVMHLGRIAMSIPLLIITTNPDSRSWISKYGSYKIIYFSLSTALNVVFTTLLVVRLCMLRVKVEQALGKLQSAYYTSFFTTIVESGAILTMWEVVHLGLLVKGVSTAEVFQQPIVYLNAITRMLIILRMAQNRAWCRDTVTASATGDLDWQVSSCHSSGGPPLPKGCRFTPQRSRNRRSKTDRDSVASSHSGGHKLDDVDMDMDMDSGYELDDSGLARYGNHDDSATTNSTPNVHDAHYGTQLHHIQTVSSDTILEKLPKAFRS